MKIIINIIVLCVIIMNQNVFPHFQHVHQYIVVEAYRLLKSGGYSIPALDQHIGDAGSGFVGEYPWQQTYVTTGAWREDIEDPVFAYDFIIINGINYALSSITHFWDADDGDLNKNYFPFKFDPLPTISIGPYENSYDKFLRYANGGWTIWFPDYIECNNTSNGHRLLITPIPSQPPKKAGISVKYNSLVKLCSESILTLEWNSSSSYEVYDVTTFQKVSPQSVSEIEIFSGVRDRIVWEILGRMCHLLGDMSIPAHTHLDEHGLLADTYEHWMGGSEEPYLYWNHENAGDFINPFNTDDDPLHFLLYIVQQATDHFGSNGPGSIGNGDNLLGGNPRYEELVFLNSLNLSSFGQPSTSEGPFNNENLLNIRDKTFPLAIRATAGLLYWFAYSANLIDVTEADENGLKPNLKEFYLGQNYPNPFNPITTFNYSIPVTTEVSIKIFDLLGNEISTLVNEEKHPGSYELSWNAADFPSGVYFYKLIANNFTDTKKMVIIK